MMTWKLWRVLKAPPHSDPIFRRSTQTHHPPSRWRRYLDYLVWVVVIALFVGYLRQSFLSLSNDLSPFIIFIGLIALGGTIYGVDWALAVSDTVALARENKTLDLLSITPRGAIGAVWALGLSQLHRASNFHNRNTSRRRVFFSLGTGLLLISVALGGMMLTVSNSNLLPMLDLTALFVAVLSSFALLVAVYVDYIQSIVVSLFVGMIVPTFSRQRFDTQVWALTSFLSIQLGTYFVTYLVCFVILPTIGHSFGIETIMLELVLLVPRLIVFFLIREVLIVLLWRWLVLQFNEELTMVAPGSKPSFGK
jgi:hypothetical protein